MDGRKSQAFFIYSKRSQASEPEWSNMHTIWIIDDECKASRRITNDCGQNSHCVSIRAHTTAAAKNKTEEKNQVPKKMIDNSAAKKLYDG